MAEINRLTRWNEETEGAELVIYGQDEWKDLVESLDLVDWMRIHEAITKLAEYEDLEEQGMLLKLSSDKVWFILDANTRYATVMSRTLYGLRLYEVLDLLKDKSKQYFLTKEKAEAALAKMKGDV